MSENFTVTSGEPELPTQGNCMVVVDPLSRKIKIPRESIYESRALMRQGIPSLCLLFLNGRCRQGAHCHQAHADPAVVMRLREEALQLPTCCEAHGDVNSNMLIDAWRDRSLSVNGVIVSISRVAFTQGLVRVLEETPAQVVSVTPNTVCRLHAATRCRYSEDCKFIHICREVLSQQLSQWVTPLIPELEMRHNKSNSPNGNVWISPPDGSTPPPQWIMTSAADGSQQFVLLPSRSPNTSPPPPYVPMSYSPQQVQVLAQPQMMQQQQQIQLSGLPSLAQQVAMMQQLNAMQPQIQVFPQNAIQILPNGTSIPMMSPNTSPSPMQVLSPQQVSLSNGAAVHMMSPPQITLPGGQQIQVMQAQSQQQQQNSQQMLQQPVQMVPMLVPQNMQQMPQMFMQNVAMPTVRPAPPSSTSSQPPSPPGQKFPKDESESLLPQALIDDLCKA